MRSRIPRRRTKRRRPRNPATGARIATCLYEACRKHNAASKDSASKASCIAAKQRESGTETHAIEKNHRQEDRTRRLRTPSLTCSVLWHSLQFDLGSDVARCLWNSASAHTRDHDRGCKQHADGHLWIDNRWLKRSKTTTRGIWYRPTRLMSEGSQPRTARKVLPCSWD